MQTPTFEGSKATSFSYPYGSSLRNSQVFVARKRFSAFVKRTIEYCEHTTDHGRSAPFTLVVSPDARHAVLSYANFGDVLDQSGCAWLTGKDDPVALDDGVFIGGSGWTWDLRRRLDQNNLNLAASARRIEGERYAAVAPIPTGFAGGGQPPAVAAQGGRRFPKYLGDGLDWSLNLLHRQGVAAIGGDFTVVVALDNHMLQIYAPIGDEKLQARLVVEKNIGVVAKWLSLMNRMIMVVSPDGAGSRLQAFTADAKPIFSLNVAFEVLQPPVAGEGGRTYLVGKGLAALDDGKLTWMHASGDPIHASTFEDGSLAIATGKRLDFVKPDGTVDQTFNAEEPLVAPPAIAGDGSVWVASPQAIYVAR